MNFSKYSYLTIEHLRLLLGYDDIRSVKLWCEKNGVFILKQGKARLVNGAEFMLTFYKPFIEHLKQKHSNWKERFHDYMEGNFLHIFESGESDTLVKAPVERELEYVHEPKLKPLPLLYPKKDRISGLYAYCQKCKTSIGSGKCQKTKKRIQSCEFPEFHTFRASIVVPNTNGQKRKKKILNTCDLTHAILKKKEFEEKLKKHNYLLPVLPVKTKPVMRSNETNSILLTECMDDFVRYLSNEGVKEYKKRKRSKGYITEVKRYLTYMCLAIKSNGIDYTAMRMDEVNETIVEWVHTYLTKERKFKNTTYNKAMGMYTALLTWLNEKRGFSIENVFIDVTRKKVRTKKVTIDKEEFDILLKTICPELGMKKGRPPRTQFYREWLPLAFEIALQTGLRREEYLRMRYCDIKTNEQGIPVYIRIENYKVNRIKGYETEEEKEFKIIPITKRMHELLVDREFHKKPKSTEYIIAPDANANRETLIRFVSSAFAHFWRQTGIDREVFLKHLRKTYLTALAEHFGDKAHIVSNHANMDVLTRHYVDDKALIERSKQFSVF